MFCHLPIKCPTVGNNSLRDLCIDEDFISARRNDPGTGYPVENHAIRHTAFSVGST
jgi:hypothetical protein